MITDYKIVIFCTVDEFCKKFDKLRNEQKVSFVL